MKKIILGAAGILTCFFSFAQIDPANTYDELFQATQLEAVFEDSKTFTDCIPRELPVKIMAKYIRENQDDDFDLRTFIMENFDEPETPQSGFVSDTTQSVEAHIDRLWDALTRHPEDQEQWTSLVALPHEYIVPGGRFREIYYWDSYFTMLGLAVSGREDMIKNMLDNFTFLIEEYGFIPNGNRTYYLSRSQPPFFSLMVKLWGEERGDRAMLPYLDALEKEYAFWMNGKEELDEESMAVNHTVRLEGGATLNRYWDYQPEPRPESYREDYELAQNSGNPEKLYRDLRAAAESGWDFSSRWLADDRSLAAIRTTDIVPVDLNCLLYHLETLLADLYKLSGNAESARRYSDLADQRKGAILRYFWDEENRYFADYDRETKRSTGKLTMASAFPLFFKLADKKQARQTIKNLLDRLEQPGGFMTTLNPSGQQWDSPNGWPPLQYTGVMALLNYGYEKDAERIARKWLTLNESVFKRTGKMMEKYDVTNLELQAGGGEYPNQDGFGWTNGVYLALKKQFE